MRFERISKVGYHGIHKWLEMQRTRRKDPSKPSPNVDLLRRGLPQGCIREITEEMGVVLADTRDSTGERLRSPRYFDPAGVALARLLLFGGGAIRFNSKNAGTEEQMDYLVLSGHVKERDASSQRYLTEESEFSYWLQGYRPQQGPTATHNCEVPARDRDILKRSLFLQKKRPLHIRA